jgi:hypothetical protein
MIAGGDGGGTSRSLVVRRLSEVKQMRFLSRLFGSNADAETQQQEQNRADCLALADDPVQFADWVFRHFIEGQKLDLDIPVEQCERLQITAEQRAAHGREMTIMSALGACMFVGLDLPVAYYNTFKRQLCAATAGELYGVPTDHRVQEMVDLIEQYIEHLSDDSRSAFSMTYLQRVHPDNPYQCEMLLVGTPLWALSHSRLAFTLVRDAYCKLKFGLSFEAVQALGEVKEQQS